MAKTPKKRGAQDATRKHDVAPLRRRIERLEERVDYMAIRLEGLFDGLNSRLSVLQGDVQGKARRASAVGRRRG